MLFTYILNDHTQLQGWTYVWNTGYLEYSDNGQMKVVEGGI